MYNVAPEDGLESPKYVEHPKIKTSYKNLCIVGSFPYYSTQVPILLQDTVFCDAKKRDLVEKY